MATENLLEFTDVSLQLRHDSAAAWTNENPVLLEGEIGIEVHPTDAKLNKFKIGDGTKAWNDLTYTYDRVELMNAILASVPKGCKVYRVEKLDAGASDESVLPDDTKVTVNNGDIAIVTTKITPTGATSAVELQKSAYIYDSTLVEKEVKVEKEVDGETVEVTEKQMLPLGWVAMTGNVDASKVIIRSDIKLAGEYTRVGNITKSSTSATADYKSSGMSVQTLLTKILSQELQPGNPTPPSLSLTFKRGSTTISSDTALEVGTKVTFSYTSTFNDGSYTYGPEPTGSTATGYSGSLKNGTSVVESKTTKDGTFSEVSIGKNDSYTMSVSATYSDGYVAKTNLGNDSGKEPGTTKKQITAGSISATTSKKITGFHPLLYYVGTDLSTVDASWFRTSAGALNKPTSGGNTTNVPVLTIAEGTKRVLVAIPSSAKKTFSKISDEAGLGTDVKDNFLPTKKTIKIKNLNNYVDSSNSNADGIDYDVWCYENVNGLSATKYTFTMANA